MSAANSELETRPPDHRPTILLLDDRVDRLVIRELNLRVYLGAKVIVISSPEDLAKSISEENPPHLIVCRASIKGENSVKQTGAAIRARNLSIPIISLGEEGSGLATDVVYIPDEDKPQTLLRTAAQILRITPQKMAQQKCSAYFEFSAKFLKFLSSSPFPLFITDGKKMEQVAPGGEDFSRKKLRTATQGGGGKFFVESGVRLKFVNAFTDQVSGASANLSSEEVGPVKKMIAVATSMDIVAMQFQQAGIDNSILELAGSCITAIENLAERSSSLGALYKDLQAAEGGYRFDHCQLITFIGFHLLKSMGWWSSYQRKALSEAAFFHDIFLPTDEDARIHSAEDLKKSGIKNSARISLILTHAQQAARELATMPEIGSETVRIVLQHHGTKTGKGFARDLTGLENLTKVFVMAEEWADYLISHSDSLVDAKCEHKLNEMRAMYPDPTAHQMIEALGALNPEFFDRDLLIGALAVEQMAEKRIKGVTHVANAETIVVNGGVVEKSAEATRVKSVTQHINSGTVVIGKSEASSEAPLAPPSKKIEFENKVREQQKIKSLSGATALMLAAMSGSLESVKKILQSEKGSAEIRKHDSERRNCMHYAAMGGSEAILMLLLEHKAQKNLVDSKRRTPLFFAALTNQTNAFDFLIAQGCRVSQQSADGTTIAMLAARNGNLHMLGVALKGGTRLDTRDLSGRTALDYAVLARQQSMVTYLKTLMEKENRG